MVPTEKISRILRDNIPVFAKYQDSLYSDKNIAELMAKSNLSENAQEAHPGIYAASNIAGNIAVTALGGAGLKAAGVASPLLRDAILFGSSGGLNSAANQDWSKPWEALGKTALDTGLSAADGMAVGKILQDLSKAITNEWNNVSKPSTTHAGP